MTRKRRLRIASFSMPRGAPPPRALRRSGPRLLLVAQLLFIAGCQPAGHDPVTMALPAERLDEVLAGFNRGVAYMERFQPVEAVAEFERVVTLAPDWPLGRLNLGIALLNTQTEEGFQRAEVELKRVIQSLPHDPRAHFALGMLLRHLTRFDEAQQAFEAALQGAPHDPDVHFQLGVLRMSEDPPAARRHLERALEGRPHHESALYALQTLLLQAGEKEAATRVLERFRALKRANAGVASGMKYGEMGALADVVRSLDPTPTGASVLPAFTDCAEVWGLTESGEEPRGWPQAEAAQAAAFTPGVAVADLDADGHLDLCLTGSAGGLFQQQAGKFARLQHTGVVLDGAVGAWFADYDGDGLPDIYLTCQSANRLYRNQGGWQFRDVTASTGTGGEEVLSLAAAWADADHDGDLDLYVICPQAPNQLWQNNGDGTFRDVAQAQGVAGGTGRSTAVLFFDLEGDYDLDLLLVYDGSPNQLFRNDRAGSYTDVSAQFPQLADAGPGWGAVAADVDRDGRQDLLLLRGPAPPRLLVQRGAGRFEPDTGFESRVGRLGAASAVVGDLDLDGDLDIVLLSCGEEAKFRHRILLNDGRGQWSAGTALGSALPWPAARGAAGVDLDGNGMLDLLIARAGAPPELWQAPAPPGRHWLTVVPQSAAPEASGARAPSLGSEMEVKTGRHAQRAALVSTSGYLTSLPAQAHFGLGESPKADYVRLAWPDAVLQSELEVAADRQWQVVKAVRKPSSCPILFSWDGQRFEFVTDFLGVGGLGFFLSPGEYAVPDPTEAVRIPPEKIALREGRYLLRIAEPLEEVAYVDHLELWVYDHPAGQEVYPDERFAANPPWPTGLPLAVRDSVPPRAAQDNRGVDLLARLREVDRRFVEPPSDERFIGYAQDHHLELDFGSAARDWPDGARRVLLLQGWVEYTYSHVNYAAAQAGLALQAPRIDVPDGAGGWRTAIVDAGFPAGLPRTMVIDVSSLPLRADGRLRLRTNMEIFWDQIRLAWVEEGPAPHRLPAAVAELRHLGYPREYSPDGRAPTLYDYHRLDQGLPYKLMAGAFTRPGDVRRLLAAADDRFVIMGRGEELALAFDARSLPALPEDWSRTVVLSAVGWCKDMDLYTAFPATVAPLPFRAMGNYPPAGSVESAPDPPATPPRETGS